MTNLSHMPLIEFDVWFQEFKIEVKTGVFWFHVIVVDSNFFRNENFDLSQALQSIFWRGKILGHKEHCDFLWNTSCCYRFLAFWLPVFFMAWDKYYIYMNFLLRVTIHKATLCEASRTSFPVLL